MKVVEDLLLIGHLIEIHCISFACHAFESRCVGQQKVKQVGG